MKRTVVALIGLAACAAPPPATRVAPKRELDDASAGVSKSMLPGFEELAARGPRDLPGMHEAARVERTTELSPTVDTCYRAIVAVDGEVKAFFADADGARGEPGEAGLVPPRGPVCARKGESFRFVLEGAPARAILWQAP